MIDFFFVCRYAIHFMTEARVVKSKTSVLSRTPMKGIVLLLSSVSLLVSCSPTHVH